MYFCNWTNVDLKFKKLVLLNMQINDANQIAMKVSTKKIVNLQLFASVSTNLLTNKILLKTIDASLL